MKKFIFCIIVIVATISSYGQKNQFVMGLDFGVLPSVDKATSQHTHVGIGAKFQYGITDALRADVDVDYVFKKGYYINQIDAIVNAHYLFRIGRKSYVYPLVGFGYASVRCEGGIYPQNFSTSKFLFNTGVGIEAYSASNLKFFLEAKYQYVHWWQKIPIQVGIAYVF